jgi:2-polyprenyl-3-methyl-5-hydroxy-6-metoxy-1,4-benzoquinol methylase
MRGLPEPARYQQAYDVLERLFIAKEDPWRLARDPFEKERIAKTTCLCLTVPHRTILECGCAEGYMTAALCKIADNVVAFDASPTAIARAQSRVPSAEISCNTLEQFPLDRHFELAVCAEMIYYCADVAGALARLAKMADYLMISYTVMERPKLDPYFQGAAAIHDEIFRRFGIWDRWVQIRGTRLLLLRSDAASWR